MPKREPLDILPKPIIFGYNRLVAVETVREFKQQLEFSLIESIVLLGSAFKPREKSTGKDIDMWIFLKQNVTEQQLWRANKKFAGILDKNYKKFGMAFDAPFWPFTVKVRTRRGAGALRSVKAFPHKLLYACPNSWVKFYLHRKKTRPLPRKKVKQKRTSPQRGRRRPK